jgi:membrane-bound ClpP family serine protease
MSVTAIIILILVGILLLLLEVFVLPGTNVAGVIGILFIIGAIVFSYRDLGTPVAHIILIVCLLLTGGSVFLGLRSNTWNRLALKSTIDSKMANMEPNEVAVGAKGISITRLNPMGRVLINDKSFEAKSSHRFIDQQEAIEVVKIEGNQIIVKLIET